jgi:putative ABC transport system permease protein
MTIGVYITYRILDVADLTVEGSIATGAAVAAHCMEIGCNPFLATFFALLSGMVAGLCTGLLHTKLKIPALLSGILSMIALYSVNLRIMGKSNVSLLKIDTVYSLLPIKTGSVQLFGTSVSEKTWQVLILGLICVIVVCVLTYVFFGTELGCAIRATGSNSKMARAQGINTDTMINIGLVLSNGLVALSGALIAQNQSFADVQMGTGSIVIGLASLIIGEVIFGTHTFKHTLVSIVGGAVVYRVIIALVLKAGMNANDLKLFTAITVAVCLSLPIFKGYLATLKKSARKAA